MAPLCSCLIFLTEPNLALPDVANVEQASDGIELLVLIDKVVAIVATARKSVSKRLRRVDCRSREFPGRRSHHD
jgi:hypothetical protein